ncbi:hypothetical protein LEP3755_17730 [Leptolyngbya sp. NIES-3755]|nr:hypothetical protein LEP3755_17730 [Leptolyngbya sp. NIES-3755]
MSESFSVSYTTNLPDSMIPNSLQSGNIQVCGIDIAELEFKQIERGTLIMSKFMWGLMTIERTMQIAALIGVVVFLGYLGVMNVKSEHAPVPSNSPTLQK